MSVSPIEIPGEKPSQTPREAARNTVKQKLEGQKAQLTPDTTGLEKTIDMREEATAKTSGMLAKLRAQMEAAQKQGPESAINRPTA